MLFQKPFTKAIEFSVISPVRSALDSLVINPTTQKVQGAVKDQLIACAIKIAKDLNVELRKIWIIGSSLTFQWDEQSDIDVNLSLKTRIEDDKLLAINKYVSKKYNNKIKIGCHPVNFKIEQGNFKRFRADAIYDLVKNRWIKRPAILQEAEIRQLINQSSSTPEFQQIMKKYHELQQLLQKWKSFSGTGQRKQALAAEIFGTTQHIHHLYHTIKDERRRQFNKCKKNPNWPSANFQTINIIYKLLESKNIGHLEEEVARIMFGES